MRSWPLLSAIVIMSLSGCTSDGASQPAPSGARPGPPTGSPNAQATAPAAMPTAAEPGFTILVRESGTGSRSIPLTTTPTGQLGFFYSCLGGGRIEIRLGTQGPGAVCDGSGHFSVIPSDGAEAVVQVTTEPDATWNLFLQQSG